MKFGLAVKVIAGLFCLVAILALTVAYSYPGEQPDWMKYYAAAEKIPYYERFDEWDRQAKLVLEEFKNYGGQMPPAEKMSWEMNLIETLLWFVPMQDRGETMTYAEGLRSLASNYKSQKKLDDAELFYRKALELQIAEQRANPKRARYPDPSELIELLKSRGKDKEALELQQKEAEIAQAIAAQHPTDPNYQAGLLITQAKTLEMQGKFEEAEIKWKKYVDLDKYELEPEYIAQVKKDNQGSVGEGMSYGLNILGKMERLAEFYERTKNYDAQEKTLLKRISIRQSSLPEKCHLLATDWDELARVYESHKKYDQAAKAILESIGVHNKEDRWEKLATIYLQDQKCPQAIQAMSQSIILIESGKLEPVDKHSLAGSYVRYAKILEKAGKKLEALKAREKAQQLAPSVTDSTRYIR